MVQGGLTHAACYDMLGSPEDDMGWKIIQIVSTLLLVTNLLRCFTGLARWPALVMAAASPILVITSCLLAEVSSHKAVLVVNISWLCLAVASSFLPRLHGQASPSSW